MDWNLLKSDCPMISRALLNPWRLASLGIGLLLLVIGSFYLSSDDWDVAICFVMGLPAYILAPWSFRQIWYFHWKWWPLVALSFWFSVDATYTFYWWYRGFSALQEFRPANFFYCTPIFWIAGFLWNVNLENLRLSITPLPGIGEIIERNALLGAKLVSVIFYISLITYVVGLLTGLGQYL